jgi:hypothetical protein
VSHNLLKLSGLFMQKIAGENLVEQSWGVNQFINSRIEGRQQFSVNLTGEMQRNLAANEETFTNEYFRDDDVAQLLPEEDGESLSLSPTADDARHQSSEGTGATDTQVPVDAAAKPNDDKHTATNDAVGFTTATSVSRRVTERTYSRFYQPIDFVALPMVGVSNTNLEFDRGQSIALPPIPTEEDAKAVKRFAMFLTITFAAIITLYVIFLIVYLVFWFRHTETTKPTSSSSLAMKFVPITCSLFIGVGAKIAREAVVARKKRYMDDARCYAGLAIFFVLLAFAGSAIAFVLSQALLTE